MRQERAKYNLYLNAPSIAEDASVLDGKDRFLTSSCQWKPAAVLEDLLYDAALGKVKCYRI
jgi:hypothetical protein